MSLGGDRPVSWKQKDYKNQFQSLKVAGKKQLPYRSIWVLHSSTLYLWKVTAWRVHRGLGMSCGILLRSSEDQLPKIDR